MHGMMMDYPLTLHHFFDRNQRLFGQKTVTSRSAGGLRRYTYADYGERVRKLANALRTLGVQQGDRVATLGWNTHRHLEFYYAVPCMGAVLHTVNIRLSPDQIAFIINDAGAKVLSVDRELLRMVDTLRSRFDAVEHIIVMQDEADLREDALDYEALLAAASPNIGWPSLDENSAAGICYSSGTTGAPKGVVYSHRAMFLHTMSIATADSLALSERDCVMPVVPMFHANAWGLPHAAIAVGANQVLPGVAPSPRELLALMQSERVTKAAGVPTIWMAVLAEWQRSRAFDLSSVESLLCGGAAPPPHLIESADTDMGTPILHSWGMTETTPVATVCRLKSSMASYSDAQKHEAQLKQGLPVLGMDVTVMDDAGTEVAWDGASAGELVVRGPWVTAGYLHVDESERFTNGWFRTGDVATIDSEGYVRIFDRTKDLVRSGGEWISSVELEGAIMGHPDVAEAAVIAVPDDIWGERPLALVVPRAGVNLYQNELLAYLRTRVARLSVPDRVVFIDEIPKTSVGKFDKKVLRERYVQST
ncbi:MAG: long-chain fatty acid--CoA ligase [Chloroflexota bacterium]